LYERVLHGISPSGFVSDDRGGRAHEARQVGSVERLQRFERGTVHRHLSHSMRGLGRCV
jgi:hypothetical protein